MVSFQIGIVWTASETACWYSRPDSAVTLTTVLSAAPPATTNSTHLLTYPLIITHQSSHPLTSHSTHPTCMTGRSHSSHDTSLQATSPH